MGAFAASPLYANEAPAAFKPSKEAPFIKIPLGLNADRLNIPADNPLTAEKVELGKSLYFDPRLSVNGKISCATCHHPLAGWADPAPTSTGVSGKKGGRNSPTVINSTYMTLQFWDGRAATLEDQALGPLVNPVEMENKSVEEVVAKLSAIPGYVDLFEKAFHEKPSAKNLAQAIASFERTVLSGNSRYDRFVAGDKTALNEAEQRGMTLFMSKGNCIQCHSGPNFSDSQFHNLGVGMNQPNSDVGRAAVTKKKEDTGAFRTPTLREISKTGPYMHDGSQKTLEEVIDFYDKGGEKNPTLSPRVLPLSLTTQEKADLVSFMKALDGNPYPNVSAPVFPK